jgi:formylglycine-generating enzyme required for sulfatase activity
MHPLAAVLTLVLAAVSTDPQLTNSLGMLLRRVEPGSFTRGYDGPQSDYRIQKHPERFDDADFDERPTHRVTITQPFFIASTEVTNAQYEQFDPAHARPKSRLSMHDDEAVVNVSYDDALAFCAWLSKKENRHYRLPTEAEWEYACRAGTTTLFNLGDRLPDAFQPWPEPQYKLLGFIDKPMTREYRADPGKSPLKVAQTPPNAWGLHDMHGNVAEWCLDWYGPYESAEQTDPVGRATGDFRVVRGGHHSQFIRMLRSSSRAGRLPWSRTSVVGFRVILADPPVGKPLPPPPLPLHQQNVDQSIPREHEVSRKSDEPFFRGPTKFVKIPPDSLGPLFSRHNHSPSITECPNGDLLAVWFTTVEEGGVELAVAASRLRRGSTEWLDASPFWDGPKVNDHYPKLWWDGKQRLYFFVAGSNCNILRTSDDSGATWSPAVYHAPISEWSNIAFRTRENFIVLPMDSSASFAISRDEGKTWQCEFQRARPIDAAPDQIGGCAAGLHHAMTQLADGSIIAYSRVDKPEMKERFQHRMPISLSRDWGKTWSYSISEFPNISSGQRPVMLRLKEGPLLFCSFTNEGTLWKNPPGMMFKDASGREFKGAGLFAALSFDEGKTWPIRKLITTDKSTPCELTDGGAFTLTPTRAEPFGYLSICQTRDGNLQLLTSRNHYTFNLAWLKQLPTAAP